MQLARPAPPSRRARSALGHTAGPPCGPPPCGPPARQQVKAPMDQPRAGPWGGARRLATCRDGRHSSLHDEGVSLRWHTLAAGRHASSFRLYTCALGARVPFGYIRTPGGKNGGAGGRERGRSSGEDRTWGLSIMSMLASCEPILSSTSTNPTISPESGLDTSQHQHTEPSQARSSLSQPPHRCEGCEGAQPLQLTPLAFV